MNDGVGLARELVIRDNGCEVVKVRRVAVGKGRAGRKGMIGSLFTTVVAISMAQRDEEVDNTKRRKTRAFRFSFAIFFQDT